MTKRYWHKRYHSDALNGYRGLNLEQRGAYTTILDLLYDSGAEGIRDDERLIAGHLDIHTRKWRALRQELLEAGKIIQIEGDRLSNNRYLKERENTLSLSEKRAEAGSKGGQKLSKSQAIACGEMPENSSSGQVQAEFEPSSTPELDLKLQTTERELDTKTAENSQTGEAIAKQELSYTRAKEVRSYIDSTTSTKSLNTKPSETKNPLDGDDDILNRINELGRIAGLNLTRPEKIATALDQLREWLGEGIDYERDILPTIKARSADNPSETVHSLRYFDAAVRKRFGLSSQGIAPAKPLAPPKPKDPIAAVDGTDDRVAEFRARLTRTVGPRVYNNNFAPEHCAIEIEDNLVRLRFRSDAEATLAEARFGDGVSTAARAMSLAPTMGALK